MLSVPKKLPEAHLLPSYAGDVGILIAQIITYRSSHASRFHGWFVVIRLLRFPCVRGLLVSKLTETIPKRVRPEFTWHVARGQTGCYLRMNEHVLLTAATLPKEYSSSNLKVRVRMTTGVSASF